MQISKIDINWQRLVMWWDKLSARRAAKKYNLDFERKCIFDYQIRYKSAGFGVVKVPMESGKIGLYQAEITRFLPGNTGQKDWKFTFIGYDI